MKRYGKLFDSGNWLDAQWWYPEADFLQLGESYDAQGIAYNKLAAELADTRRMYALVCNDLSEEGKEARRAKKRVAALEAALREEHGGKHHEPECPLCAVLVASSAPETKGDASG